MTVRRPRRLLSPLSLRLTAAFVTVAIAAVGVYAVLTVTSTRSQLSDLVLGVHREDAAAAAVAAGRAFETAGGWEDADLLGAVAVAARGQATLAVRDANGNLVSAPAQEAA
ncbi:MAG: sensor histidine kinase, partial [Actinomycetota bacterium]